MKIPKEKCTCGFPKETAREIGHYKGCPREKDKTWWQEKPNECINCKYEKDGYCEKFDDIIAKLISCSNFEEKEKTKEKWGEEFDKEFGIHFKNSPGELKFCLEFIEELLKEERERIIKHINNTDDWGETYCKEDENLLKEIKKDLIDFLNK